MPTTGLARFRFYKGLKEIKYLVRDEVIEKMPKAHRIPDAVFLKEHTSMTIRLTAAIYLTDADDIETKADYINQILFELFLIQDEVEEQERAHVISLSTAAGIYVKIRSAMDEINKFRNYLKRRRDSDGLRATESAE